MLTKRSFLKRLVLATAGAAAAPFLPKGSGLQDLPVGDPAYSCTIDLNPTTLSPFWLQTSRWSLFKSSPEYLKAVWRAHYRELRIMARDGDVPLDTLLTAYYIGYREKQQKMKECFESFMLGRRINQEETF